MKKVIFISALFISSVVFMAFLPNEERKQAPSDDYLADLLFNLGEPKPDHYIENTDPEKIQQGKDLIHQGRTELADGKMSKHISKFFKCISCHNVVREDLDLSIVDPEQRLSYAKENKIPYLQGSTFYGMVNRETWYNDDYVKKYGSLVEPAKNSLKSSIQLCAQVCSQGRTLEDWEMESMLAYLWSIGLKKSDLNITDGSAFNGKSLSDKEMIEAYKDLYLQKSPATFGEVPKDKSKGYEGITGRPEQGKIIYELGCRHCHREKGESDVVLDYSVPTINWLKRNITNDNQLSLYEIVRKGTYSEKGHKEYMPHYTMEKMSHQQIEDLRAFIEGHNN